MTENLHPSLKAQASIGLANYISQLEDYCSANQGDINAKIDLMSTLAKSGCLLKYETLAKDILEANPLNNLVHRLHGKYLLFIKRDITSARKSLRKACALNPNEPAWVKYFANMHVNYYEKLPGGILYTAIPKNGSTTIKTYCARLQNMDEEEAHDLYGNPYFSANLIDQETANCSKKMVILRDPVDRFLSYHNKNILESDSLAYEIGRPGLTEFYGLMLKPAISEFAEQVWKYAFCFDDVLHHILPQCAYIRHLQEYDVIGGVSDIGSILQACWPHQFLRANSSPPERRMTSNKQNKPPSPDILAFLQDIYSDDTDLIKIAEHIHGTSISTNRLNSFGTSTDSSKSSSQLYPTTPSKDKDERMLRPIVAEVREYVAYLTNSTLDMYTDILRQIQPQGDTFRLIEEALINKKAFSLVRVGDGEGNILGFGDISPPKDIEDILDIWFGFQIQDEAVALIRDGLTRAIENADVLGIPGRKRSILTNPFCRVQTGILSAYSYFHRSGLPKPGQHLTNADIHIQLDGNRQLEKMLRMVARVTLITCRTELRDHLCKQYPNLDTVNILEVPAEHRFGMKPLYCNHYPDRFNEIKLIISSSDFQGELVLVAAGVLGKIYCLWIKEAGGIAIDIGSIADKLAGVPSRPYIR